MNSVENLRVLGHRWDTRPGWMAKYIIERIIGSNHLNCCIVFSSVVTRLCYGGVIVIASHVWYIGGRYFCSVISQNVGTIHVSKVGTSMEHIEVDTCTGGEDVSKDNSEFFFRQSVVVWLKPVVKPSWPKLRHKHWSIGSELLDPL